MNVSIAAMRHGAQVELASFPGGSLREPAIAQGREKIARTRRLRAVLASICGAVLVAFVAAAAAANLHRMMGDVESYAFVGNGVGVGYFLGGITVVVFIVVVMLIVCCCVRRSRRQSKDVPATKEDMMKALKPYEELFENSDKDNIMPEVGNYTTSKKQRMATYNWTTAVPKKDFRGTVVLVHGFAEHLGRYNHVANFFCKRGYNVCGIDHFGHGLSEGFQGSKGTIMSHKDLSDNLKDYIMTKVKPKEGPQFIYSHSTGGMVTFLALDGVVGLANTWGEKFKGVVYSAPLIRQPDWRAKLMYRCPLFVTCILECFGSLEISGIDEKHISTHEAFLTATRKDEKCFGDKVNLSMARTILTGTVEVSSKLENPTYPFFVLQSPKDKLVDPVWSMKLYEKAESEIKKIDTSTFSDWRHSLHNHEKEWEKPLELAAGWFEDPISGKVV